jgi:acyl-CoA dehydrogenase
MTHPVYPEHALFIDTLHRMMASDLEPHLKRWEQQGYFPDEVFTQLGTQGYLGILIDEAYGGIGGDYSLAAAWCETLGELRDHGLVTAVNMHSLVISSAVNRYGTASQKERWLPRAVTGDAIGAYAFTEPGAGSDLASLRTKAIRVANGWQIDGSKTFITNGARADFILVLARTDPAAGYNGFTTFLVDTSLPGFSVARTLDKLGWRSSDTAELSFENLVVPEDAVLGTVGQGWMQAANNLNWERLMLTLTTLGGARACLRDTTLYARNRTTFGRPIAEHRGIKEMLAEMRRRLILGEALTYHALTRFLRGEPCRAEVSQAKRQLCDDAVWIADRAIQIHGGYGYTTEFSPERWWRDLRLMPIGGGTSEVMGLIVRKELGLV